MTSIQSKLKDNWLIIGIVGSIIIVLTGYFLSGSQTTQSSAVDDLIKATENKSVTLSPTPSSEVSEEPVDNTGQINVNTAGLEELETLSGIGPVKAQAIIDDRNKNGAFESADDLDRVKGIGPATIEKIRDKITI